MKNWTVDRINRTILECKGFSLTNWLKRGYSINRTILECKDILVNAGLLKLVGINRTILECKDMASGNIAGISTVLIEPYWNVKGPVSHTAS